jgi:GDPmannose 4,6-dehydratase
MKKRKVAFITGIAGQDGSYLSEFLLEKGYIVHGILRRNSLLQRTRIDHIINNKKYKNKFFIHYGDICDSSSLVSTITKCMPDEIYHLAAQSHVKISFEIPEYTFETIGLGTLKLLEIIKSFQKRKRIKMYNASSSEQYGDNISKKPRTETTIFNPVSPYAAAKVYAHNICRVYRESYDLFICNGILFNHESPRRGENFVSKKIVLGVKEIINGSKKPIILGNLYAERDWGYAKEYVESMWKMMQQNKPDDYVIATKESFSVKYFINECFKFYNERIFWKGKSLNEKAYLKKNNQLVCKVSQEYFRPLEVNYLRGDYGKAKKILAWEPKIKLKKLIEIMLTE